MMAQLAAQNRRITLAQQRIGAAIAIFSVYLALRPEAFSSHALSFSALAVGLVGGMLFLIGFVTRNWPKVGWWVNLVAAASMGLYLILS